MHQYKTRRRKCRFRPISCWCSRKGNPGKKHWSVSGHWVNNRQRSTVWLRWHTRPTVYCHITARKLLSCTGSCAGISHELVCNDSCLWYIVPSFDERTQDITSYLVFQFCAGPSYLAFQFHAGPNWYLLSWVHVWLKLHFLVFNVCCIVRVLYLFGDD